MRPHFAAIATAATLCLFLLSAPGANAMTVGTAPGIQQGLAKTDLIEQARRVCRRNAFTGRRECWVDRSRPPTVCHRIRGTNRLDCY